MLRSLTSRTIRAIALLLVLVPLGAHAQRPERPDSIVNRVFAPWSSTTSPGCAVGVSDDGRVVLERGYGMANLETDTPIRASSIFHVASVSKQFTAMAVMLLVRDGRLSLDDDVRKYVPELPDYGHPITIRHMLQHTSGLRDQWTLLSLARGRFEEERVTEADVMDIVPRQKALNFAPGTEYLYSNTGYTLAGVIVRRVSGQSLKDFAQERIFGPLGMTSTHFHDDYTMVVRGRTSAYAPRGRSGEWRVSIPNYDTYGATSLFTTVGDLLQWQANFDQPVVGDRALLAEMQASGVLVAGDSTGYGLGLQTGSHRGHALVGHGGADAGYRAYLGRLPDEGLSVAVLCNFASANAGQLARGVLDAYLGAEEPRTVATNARERESSGGVTLTEAEMARFAGAYFDASAEDVVFVTVRDDRLVLGRTSGPPLVPLGPGRFAVPERDTELVFSAGSAERFEMRAMTGRGRVRQFERRKPAVATPRALAAFAGRYYSEELDATYRVTATDSTLELRTGTANPRSAQPAFEDAFLMGGSLVRFTRARNGAVSGFVLTSGRVRGIRFERVGAR